MTNKEFYADKILELACKGYLIAVNKKTRDVVSCKSILCDNCVFNQPDSTCFACTEKWANAEYVPVVDWSKVEVDTPIFVSNFEFTAVNKGEKRHFAKYENGMIYAYSLGGTSWTADKVTGWEYARLATEEEFKTGRALFDFDAAISRCIEIAEQLGGET